MNFLINTQTPLTMSSRDMADLTEKRHDSVKRTIDMLFSKGVIGSPQNVNFKNINGVDGVEYLVEKRDTFVVVAQLSPEFTARLVDRWQELESGTNKPKTALELAREQVFLLERLEEQQRVIEQQKPMVQFVEDYVESDGTISLREAGKVLGMGQKKFIEALEKWVLYRTKAGTLAPYIFAVKDGYFVVKTGTNNDMAYTQTRVTPKGLVYLSEILNKPVDKTLLQMQ
jgi:phage antirepressor YoqD-like protein